MKGIGAFLIGMLALAFYFGPAEAVDWTYTGLDDQFWVRSLIQVGDGTIYAGAGHGPGQGAVYKSIDGGDTWTATGELTDAEGVMALVEGSDGALYAGTRTFLEPVYKSTDNGDTWTRMPDIGHDGGACSMIEDSEGTLFIGLCPYGAVIKSEDGGVNWETTGGLGSANSVWSLMESSNGTLYAGTGENVVVFESIDSGDTWTATDDLLDAWTDTMALLQTDSAIYAGTSFNDAVKKATGAAIYRTDDAGTIWDQVAYYPTQALTASLLHHADGTLIGGIGVDITGIVRSSDGVTWTDVDAVTAATGTVMSMLQTQEGYVLAGLEPDQGVYKACIGCDIAGVCHMEDVVNPANPCEVCDPEESADSWSAVDDGTSCDDGLYCNGTDSCLAGVCDEHAGDPCPEGDTCVEDDDSCNSVDDDDDNDNDDANDDDDATSRGDDDDDDDDDGCCGC
jgi:photosystem II stability/assembly factor-like uncharacterized protein